MFEHKSEPLLSWDKFRNRLVQFFLLAFAVTVVWLVIGGVGFHFLAALSWEDAFYNAAMMVSTMGPVFTFTTTPAKMFAALYALGSSLVFIGAVSIAFAPIIHRFFHMFHLEAQDAE
jgi:NhaP-type Na+/H+ or K+/H+ antiporter